MQKIGYQTCAPKISSKPAPSTARNIDSGTRTLTILRPSGSVSTLHSTYLNHIDLTTIVIEAVAVLQQMHIETVLEAKTILAEELINYFIEKL